MSVCINGETELEVQDRLHHLPKDLSQKEQNHMNQRRIFTLVLVTVGLVSGVLVDRTLSRSTNAEQVNTTSSDRWEYCVISSVNWDSDRRIYYARLCYIQSAGCRYSDIEGPPIDENDGPSYAKQKTLAKAVATLGQSGWEMVGEFAAFAGKDQQQLYFKRRLK